MRIIFPSYEMVVDVKIDCQVNMNTTFLYNDIEIKKKCITLKNINFKKSVIQKKYYNQMQVNKNLYFYLQLSQNESTLICIYLDNDIRLNQIVELHFNICLEENLSQRYNYFTRMPLLA